MHAPALPLPARPAPPAPSTSAPAARAGAGAGVAALDALVVVLLCAAVGAVQPLWDADLPMHLATGEWLAVHGRVPDHEPFAWTRAGAPFHALGWGAQLTFYAVYSALGRVGLHLLNGLLCAAAAGAALLLARAARWPAAVGLAAAVANVLVAELASAGLRPQTVMFALVPLAWACALRAADAEAPSGARRWARYTPYAGLALAAAVAANAHLYFPLVLAPVAALAVAGTLAPRRALAAALAVLVGWCATPNVLVWPAVLRFWLTPYLLYHAPTPIAELQPGFGAALHGQTGALVVGLSLALLPWALGALRGRERLAAVAYWAAGLGLFACAVRGFAVWWLLVLPYAGGALARAAERAAARGGAARPARPAVRAAAVALAAVALAVQWPNARRDDRPVPPLAPIAERQLAHPAAALLDPLVAWLAAHATPPQAAERPGGPRVLTSFDYGSYVTWTLPGYSASADSRGSFPDSALAPESMVPASARADRLGPWRSADLALIPLRWRTAAVLDTAAGWRRVGIATAPADAAVPPDTAGLWVRTAWWARAGRTALPAVPFVAHAAEVSKAGAFVAHAPVAEARP